MFIKAEISRKLVHPLLTQSGAICAIGALTIVAIGLPALKSGYCLKDSVS